MHFKTYEIPLDLNKSFSLCSNVIVAVCFSIAIAKYYWNHCKWCHEKSLFSSLTKILSTTVKIWIRYSSQISRYGGSIHTLFYSVLSSNISLFSDTKHTTSSSQKDSHVWSITSQTFWQFKDFKEGFFSSMK